MVPNSTRAFCSGLQLLLMIAAAACMLPGQVDAAFKCPTNCTCVPSRNFVRCIKQGLTGVPDDLPSDVELLDLSNNLIKDLSGLGNLTKLTDLSLSHNQIKDWKPDWLGGLPALRRLMLTQNLLTEPPMQLCSRLPALRSLYIDNNHLARSFPEDYKKCTKLSRLTLSNNAFDTIDNGTLCSLGAAGGAQLSLKLNRLKLVKVQAGALACLSGRLESLDLSQNSLSQESLEGLIGESSLKHLHTLSLRMSSKLRTVSPKLLTGADALRVLALDGSVGLAELSSDALALTPNLNRLSLSKTAVAGWNGSCIDQLTQLRQLDLRNTSVATIGGLNGLDANPLRLLANLSSKFANLSLTGAALTCDCSLYWLTRQLRLPAVLARLADAGRLVCARPEALRGRKLADFQPANCDGPPPGFFTTRMIALLASAGAVAVAVAGVVVVLAVHACRRRRARLLAAAGAGPRLTFNDDRDPLVEASQRGGRDSVWIRLRRLFSRGRPEQPPRPPIYDPPQPQPEDYLDAINANA